MNMAQIQTNIPLANFTRFRTGGAAEYFFQPENAGELAEFLRTEKFEAITVLGMGSNVLIRDCGIKGLVIHTGKMNKIKAIGTEIMAGAGAALPAIAVSAAERGIGGFEFMAGIPGTAAGGLITNAGCFGGQISDVLASVGAVDFAGRPAEWGADECGLEYRSSRLPEGFVITDLKFRGCAGNPAEIRQKIEEILVKKNAAQPTDARTAGSTFKNPPIGPAAWQKIKNAFPAGLGIGGARISDKHANFIVAGENCSSADIETLIRKIQDETGLELEIKILG